MVRNDWIGFADPKKGGATIKAFLLAVARMVFFVCSLMQASLQRYQTKKPPLSRRLLLCRDDWIGFADPQKGGAAIKAFPLAVARVVFFVCSLLQAGLQRCQTKKPPLSRRLLLCRDDWIRTSDPLHPMQVRYRAALRPEL